jgi:hypothetical protein
MKTRQSKQKKVVLTLTGGPYHNCKILVSPDIGYVEILTFTAKGITGSYIRGLWHQSAGHQAPAVV